MWAVIILLMVVLFNLFNQPPSSRNQLSYSSLMQEVHNGRVNEVLIQGQNISGRMTDGTLFSAYAPFDPTMVEELMKNNVNVKAEPREESPWYMTLLVSWLPMILLVGIWVFFMRQMQGGGGKAMSFGRSRARMISQDSAKVTFDDVAGVDEAKEELSEVVDFLSNPKKFTRLGGRIPKGILLVGSPGTGKTLLAKAVAGEAGVPFFSISGSDFVEMFVGVGASRVRDLFAQGKKNAPCLIFIDEIDAVGRQRGAGLGGGHDEREQTLNQLLVEMDGFEANEGVILIAATNRPDVLDPALLRPGRFDRQVVVPTPDVRGRKRILEVHSRRAPLAPDVDLDRVARSTPGMSGADLENLVNEAALLAAKQNKDFVAMNDFEEAKDKLIMGKARRTMVLSDNEKRNTAYHEAGHAIVSKFMPESNPVHKITIIPRGRALGFTAYVPEEDKYSVTRTELEGRIAMALGGRAAELIIFGKYTSGAMQDIKMATQTARQMVCELGMSEVIGPVAIGESNSEVFIGREWVATKNHSEETSRIVDGEVKRIINEGMSKAETILQEHKDILHKTAEALLEYETISGEDLAAIIKGEAMPITLKDSDGGKGGRPGKAAESGDEFKLEE
ncbi:MAG: ATP-dependent zinc metalloprotease FtsH [Deltaproteobacteria bacterium]|jgi:cell division protease FtsH|nr:ATP-dependent zinc metalloprotease FtsH [Deltaproteobacteria bacterium]